jgi:D-glycero-D-manno-heptose 1,7-bisphosphate phosphatase
MADRRDRVAGTVFLDRDGTINRKAPSGDYVKTVAEFAFLPTAPQAIRALNEARHRVIVVTNQRGIALERMTEEDLRRIHDHMFEELAASGAAVDTIYHCPHDHGMCECRKPQVGMFLRAAADHPDIKLDRSVMFGDSQSDMAAGTTLGMVRVLVQTAGVRAPMSSVDTDMVDHRANTLLDGVEWFLAQDLRTEYSAG